MLFRDLLNLTKPNLDEAVRVKIYLFLLASLTYSRPGVLENSKCFKNVWTRWNAQNKVIDIENTLFLVLSHE